MEDETQKKKHVYGRLYRLYKTACEMMLDRGYVSVGEELTEDRIKQLEEDGPEGFLTEFQNKFPDLTMDEDNLHKEIFANEDGEMVFFIFRRKALNQEALKLAFQTLENNSAQGSKYRVIISLPGDIEKSNTKLLEGKDTKDLRNKIDVLKKEGFLEIFDESTLVYNITRHNLVPQHIPLTDLEKSELLAKYKITPNQLPKILMSDPVTKYFGMKRGDVFKIVRTSETAGKYVTYRICV